MKVEQYVMAYGVEQDRIRALLPEEWESLRPVFRLNAEIRENRCGYVEFLTAVEKDGRRGWLCLGCWSEVPFDRSENGVTFQTDFLTLSFFLTGKHGGCPAERDNDGCYFFEPAEGWRPPESISAAKEFCDCRFQWRFTEEDAGGVSCGKTLPAIPEEKKRVYQKEGFTVENGAKIPCRQVLGSYVVRFDRWEEQR